MGSPVSGQQAPRQPQPVAPLVARGAPVPDPRWSRRSAGRRVARRGAPSGPRASSRLASPRVDFRLRDQDGRPSRSGTRKGPRAHVPVLELPRPVPGAGRRHHPGGRQGRTRRRGDLLVYGVSVDPVGDTTRAGSCVPEEVRRLRRSGPLPGRLRAQLAPVWRAYGIAPINATPRGGRRGGSTYDRLQHSAGAGGARPYRARPSRRRLPAAGEAYPDTNDLRYRGRPGTRAGLDFEHSAYVMLMDKQGEQRVGIHSSS